MNVLEHFRTITQIPRCSAAAEKMKAYLLERAETYGYAVHTDPAGNILCTHPQAETTLQCHYDMVCIGTAPQIELVEEEDLMRAEGSSLGADNGMGVAMMLALMEMGAAVDCLFTSDEEIGLVGARALEVPLKTPVLLNLDSERFGEITIGCAGGVDLNVTLPLKRERRRMHCYSVELEGYPGGHSGVDIDKDIPNAIKELAAELESSGASLIEIRGGERRNAIARQASARVAFETPVHKEGFVSLGESECDVICQDVVGMLHGFAHGIRGFDTAVGVVETSINLAQVDTDGVSLRIKLSARSMQENKLRRIESETRACFEAFGASVESEGFYAPWPPEEHPFLERVRSVYEAVTPVPVRVTAIHAGLECGLIKERYPQMQMASIGPTIRFPHSTRENVDLASVESVFEVLKALI